MRVAKELHPVETRSVARARSFSLLGRAISETLSAELRVVDTHPALGTRHLISWIRFAYLGLSLSLSLSLFLFGSCRQERAVVREKVVL